MAVDVCEKTVFSFLFFFFLFLTNLVLEVFAPLGCWVALVGSYRPLEKPICPIFKGQTNDEICIDKIQQDATVCRYLFTASLLYMFDRLCGLVVRVSGYRYRGLGFDSRRYQIFCVAVVLERGPLSLVRSIEELLE